MGHLYRRTSGGCWYAAYRDGSGRTVRRSTKTRVKAAAQKVLDKWQTEAYLLGHGVAVVSADLETLLAEYLTAISGNGLKHVELTESRLRRVIAACSWRRVGDITQHQAEAAVLQLTDLRNDKPLSKRTQSHYLGSLKAFTRWLTQTRLVLARDPLAAVRKPNFERDRKLTRRYLLWEEWHWLKHGPNAVLYQTAIQTGYRVAELAALTPASLGPDFLRLAAGHTKNGQDAKQYITPDLAAQLDGCLPFELPWDGAVYRTARLLRDDLAAARAKYESEVTNPDKWLLRPTDAAGRVLDFHALRHTCGAWLALAGCQPKVVQSMMRHSTITLTFDTYGHLFPGAERDAVAHFAGM